MQFQKSAVVGVLITLCLSTDSWCRYIPEKKPAGKGKIQMCGNALTTFIIEVCDGFVGSHNQANLSADSLQTKITENCCDQQCTMEYLENYCVHAPLFINKKSKEKIFEKLGLGMNLKNSVAPPEKSEKKSPSEDNPNNQNNNINRSWPSIEIGTVSPEIDQFGGQPIVMFKKSKSNAI